MPDILIRNAESILTMDDERRELAGADILLRAEAATEDFAKFFAGFARTGMRATPMMGELTA